MPEIKVDAKLSAGDKAFLAFYIVGNILLFGWLFGGGWLHEREHRQGVTHGD